MWRASISRTARVNRSANASRWCAMRRARRAATSGCWPIWPGRRSASRAFATARCSWPKAQPFALDTALDPHAGSSRRGGVRLQGVALGRAPRATRCCSTTGRSCSRSRRSPARASRPWCARAESSPIARVVNRQGGGISAAALTEKDLEDIRLAAELGIDYLAVSFARDADDIRRAQAELRRWRGEARVVRQDRAARGARQPVRAFSP